LIKSEQGKKNQSTLSNTAAPRFQMQMCWQPEVTVRWHTS